MVSPTNPVRQIQISLEALLAESDVDPISDMTVAFEDCSCRHFMHICYLKNTYKKYKYRNKWLLVIRINPVVRTETRMHYNIPKIIT